MYAVPPTWIRSKLSPFSEIRPRPPLPARSSRSSVIGDPPLTIEPETWTELALSAATLASATISAGALDAMPLPEEEPEEEPPQPPSTAAISTSAIEAVRGGRRRKLALILDDVFDHALIASDRAQESIVKCRTRERQKSEKCEMCQ